MSTQEYPLAQSASLIQLPCDGAGAGGVGEGGGSGEAGGVFVGVVGATTLHAAKSQLSPTRDT